MNQQPKETDIRPVVMVAIPTYTGDARASTIGRVYSGTKGRHRLLQSPTGFSFFHFGSSLLARTFNELWCVALNYKLIQGQRIDYFAMCHADVTPAEGWIDTLIDRMESHRLDLLSAVVPIKSDEGLSSTAYTKAGRDTFKPLGRLTMHEVHRLPETFTGEHVGPGIQLLNNTGCWVCRFDPAWIAKVHFEINDRIVFDAAKNCFSPKCEPEDWHFSRQLHQLGLKVGATRAVSVVHHGTSAWGNMTPFGNPIDQVFRQTSILDEPKLAAAPAVQPAAQPSPSAESAPDWFPHDVEGWLTVTEGVCLNRLAAGKDVLEIGSYCGRSTVCIAKTAKRVDCIDPFDGRATPDKKSTYEQFEENLKRYGIDRERVFTAKHTTAEWASVAREEPFFDLAFIDGAHDYDNVKLDIREATKRLRPDGLLAFHDYRTFPGEHDGRWDSGVTKAVNELLADGWRLVERQGSVAVLART